MNLHAATISAALQHAVLASGIVYMLLCAPVLENTLESGDRMISVAALVHVHIPAYACKCIKQGFDSSSIDTCTS